MADNYPNKASVDTMIANFIAEKENELTLLSSGAVFDSSYKSYIYSLREARKNPSLKNVSLALKDLKMNMTLRSLNKTEIDLMNAIKTELDSYSETLTKLGASITYSLKYTKDSYTLQEAKDEMEKKPLEQYTGIMTS